LLVTSVTLAWILRWKKGAWKVAAQEAQKKADGRVTVGDVAADYLKRHVAVIVAIGCSVAGAAVACLLAWSGKRARSSFHDAMKESRLSELL
jgi:hypothetical protein